MRVEKGLIDIASKWMYLGCTKYLRCIYVFTGKGRYNVDPW